jgi:hypothetical protein
MFLYYSSAYGQPQAGAMPRFSVTERLKILAWVSSGMPGPVGIGNMQSVTV